MAPRAGTSAGLRPWGGPGRRAPARRPQATADHPGSPGDAAGYSTGRLPRCVIVPLPVAASRPSFRRRMRSAAPNPWPPLARVAAPTRKAGKVNGLSVLQVEGQYSLGWRDILDV